MMTMKKFFCSLLVCFSLSAGAFAQGIEFFHGSWAEAQAKAKAEGKLIFADAFASWCGPCKRMAAETFPDPGVGAFFNANFVCVKYDMEKPENAEFATAFPVRSYPTLLFIDGDGKLVKKEVGARSPDALVELGRSVLGSLDNIVEMEEKYAAGDRDPAFVFQYVKALNRSGKPSLQYTNEYLNSQKDLSTPFNLKFILEGTQEADSRVFDLLIKNRAAIAKQEGVEAVDRKIAAACGKTVDKAVEFRNETLLEEAKTKMAAALPDQSVEFAFKADTRYYAAAQDPKKYLKTVQAFQKSTVKNNAARLNELVLNMTRSFPKDESVLKQAEKWAKSAAETGGLPEYYMTLAGVYKYQGNKDAALDAALAAKKLLGEDKQNMGPKIDSFIRGLDAQ
jgi:thiol-disulfide isomerase/thioredoxin